jgi:hypothetical protein
MRFKLHLVAYLSACLPVRITLRPYEGIRGIALQAVRVLSHLIF